MESTREKLPSVLGTIVQIPIPRNYSGGVFNIFSVAISYHSFYAEHVRHGRLFVASD
jgi:hypothetical protein